MRKLTDDDDILKYDKFHVANLLSRPTPTMFTDHDIVITAVAHTQPSPPPSLSTSPHPTPPFERAKHGHVVTGSPGVSDPLD